ncbi:MAG: hypothetical protein L3K17_09420, partial [Thermoplasmata archaeon]|nr:hypothetical protein [Thermoplasmata archaeon]
MVRAFWTYSAILILAVGFATPAIFPTGTPRAASPGITGPPPGTGPFLHTPNDHIQHVITVVMENHDYDSFFA